MAAKITVFDNGPMKIENVLQMVDAEGRVWDLGGRETIVVCRCGKSANAPFCDGAHKADGFASCPRAAAGAAD